MTRPLSLAALGFGLAMAAGCAAGSIRPSAATWQFPASYRASQVVRVTASDGTHEFLASVSRTGRRVEVTLFDPVLQAPLLRAIGDGSSVEETFFAEGLPARSGSRLVGILRTLHGLGFGPGGSASAEGWRFALSDFQGAPGCRFPMRITVEHPPSGTLVQVDSTDVSCDAPPR